MNRFTFVLLASTLAAGSAAAQPADPSAPPADPTAPPVDTTQPPALPAPPEAPQPPAPPVPPTPVAVPSPADNAVEKVEVKDDTDKKAKKDKKGIPLEVKPGGYVQVDGRRFLNGAETHDLTVRRLRVKLDGSAGKVFKFRTLVDFAGSKVVVNDAWIEGGIAPELQIRAGKDKAQFGLERLQSDAQLTMIERAYPTQLSPDRDIGVWLRGDIEKGILQYAVGAVDGTADNAIIESETDNELEYNAHLLVAPFAKRKELGDLAVGGAATFGRTEGTLASPGLTNVRSSGQLTLVKWPTSTTDVTATALAFGYRTRWTAHGYYYRGPAGVIAEYVRDNERVKLGTTHELVNNSAWQLAAMVAVTPGDEPSYKSIKPKHPFDLGKRAIGAIELTARYAQVHLDLDAFDGGILKPATSFQAAREFTAGVNWYFNEFLRLQINYSVTTIDSANSTLPPSQHVIAARFQASL